MKQVLVLVFVGLILLSAPADVLAQRNKTKCPPGKSFFKSDKKTRFWAGIGKKHPKEKVFYKPEQTDVANRKSERAEQKENRESWYITDNRRNKKKLQKLDDKPVASTNCPPRR